VSSTAAGDGLGPEFGVPAAPVGLDLSDWEIHLHRGRHTAVGALRAWNDPTGTFRTENFALLFVSAWHSVADHPGAGGRGSSNDPASK
jgi:hypothetical protein